MNIESELSELRARVAQLGKKQTRRGVTNMRGAAEYLNRSREWLRVQHLNGTGPRRLPNGQYAYADLDEFLEQ
jgi:hypothetical protein